MIGIDDGGTCTARQQHLRLHSTTTEVRERHQSAIDDALQKKRMAISGATSTAP